MATLYIAEYARCADDSIGGLNPIVDEDSLLAENTVTVSTEQDSAVFNAATKIVRISTDTACHIKFGTAPTATTSMKYLPANSVEYFGVKAGASWKLSVIAHS